MKALTRRAFLQMTAGFSASLAAVLFGPVSSASARSPLQADAQNDGVFPDGTIFVQGRVIKVDKLWIVLQDDEHMITTTLDYSPEAMVWKGEVTSWDAIEVDDFIFARGLPVEGRVVAIKIWANIENLYATVSKTENDGLSIKVLSEKYKGQKLKVKADHKTLFNEEEDSHALSRLVTNQEIQVLGLMQRDGVLKATKIWY